MVEIAGRLPRMVDLSIAPSLCCDLSCPFCMYGCGPDNYRRTDPRDIAYFLDTVDWSYVGAVGVYGGEPSADLELYSWVLDRVSDVAPGGVPRFTITNGSWSTGYCATKRFIRWARGHGLRVFVSSNAAQVAHQNRAVLEWLSRGTSITLKEPDRLQPMGRLASPAFACSSDRCSRAPIRMVLMPDGVYFQSCDGVYPRLCGAPDGFGEAMSAAIRLRDSGGADCPWRAR